MFRVENTGRDRKKEKNCYTTIQDQAKNDFKNRGMKKMVKPIMKDIFFLGQKSEPATKVDLQVGRDLMDTLAANRERCVGGNLKICY